MPSFPHLAAVTKAEAYGASTTWGVGVNTGGPHTKGAWTEIVAATGIRVDLLMMTVTKGGDGDQDMLFDIGIGGAGSEVVIVPNLLICFNANQFMADIYYIPITLPAGSRIAMRGQSLTANKTPEFILHGFNYGFANRPAFHQAVSFGADTSDSGGTQVDPGGTANTKGAWAELTASLTIDAKSLLVMIGNRGNTIRNDENYLLDIGVGGAGSEVVVVPDLHFIGPGTGDQLHPRAHLVPCNIPAGSRVAARGRCTSTDATDRLFDVAGIAFG